mmetsp:Transcript_11829/g.28068  ORF Transcript_11829/g.28068 Transcript_11829/m.28068 type:complete len:260 (-) Transcript_11829:100-879(-)
MRPLHPSVRSERAPHQALARCPGICKSPRGCQGRVHGRTDDGQGVALAPWHHPSHLCLDFSQSVLRCLRQGDASAGGDPLRSQRSSPAPRQCLQPGNTVGFLKISVPAPEHLEHLRAARLFLKPPPAFSACFLARPLSEFALHLGTPPPRSASPLLHLQERNPSELRKSQALSFIRFRLCPPSALGDHPSALFVTVFSVMPYEFIPTILCSSPFSSPFLPYPFPVPSLAPLRDGSGSPLILHGVSNALSQKDRPNFVHL